MSTLISLATILGVIICVLQSKYITIKGGRMGAYWVVAALGALALIVTGQVELSFVVSKLLSADEINPLKILTLFISMSMFSVFLDKVGFFRYLANETLQRAKYSQRALFVLLYAVVSLLTVFTSNDIVVLTFTPFICYFTRCAKINPLPYLIAEFVAANTWSMALIIGNPTNIYIATSQGMDFVEYLRIMALPTLASGLVSFGVLYAMFRGELRQTMTPRPDRARVSDVRLLYIGLCHIIGCTLSLSVSHIIGVEMWIISLLFALSMFVCVEVYSLTVRRRARRIIRHTLRSAPWETIPFVLSMFVLILSQEQSGVVAQLASLLNRSESPILAYGLSSLVVSNLLNNIPMSILFTSVLEFIPTHQEQLSAAFGVVVGSNLGALLSPLGALAGVMWSNILDSKGVHISFVEFVARGAVVSIPAAVVAIAMLHLVLM